MEKELEQFRQEVQRLRAGRQAGSRPFPEAMKAFAVRYLAEAQRAGRTMHAAAALKHRLAVRQEKSAPLVEDPGAYLLRATLAAIEQPGTVTLPASSD